MGRLDVAAVAGDGLVITHLIDPEQFAETEALITGDAYRHLFRARRLAVGSQLRIVDGRGHARWAVIEQVDRRQALVRAGEPAPTNEPAVELTLLVAPLRPERASWLVEKATELGVVAVRFINCERGPRSYGEGQLDRLRRVARAAVEQCHRSRLPEISGVHPWGEVEELLAPADERWVLDVGGEAAGSLPGTEASKIAVAIGPEGGWSDSERSQWQLWCCQPLGLGERVLRVETAALAAAARILLD